jgi:hypothetical protein
MMRTALLLPLLALAAAAVDAAPLRDPAQPPSAVQRAAQAQNRVRPASVGATLDTEAESHLRASFDAADTAHRGTLSRAEAQAGGFGWIANHFDAIDTRHAGRVSFEDVRRYLKSRDANAATR